MRCTYGPIRNNKTRQPIRSQSWHKELVHFGNAICIDLCTVSASGPEISRMYSCKCVCVCVCVCVLYCLAGWLGSDQLKLLGDQYSAESHSCALTINAWAAISVHTDRSHTHIHTPICHCISLPLFTSTHLSWDDRKKSSCRFFPIFYLNTTTLDNKTNTIQSFMELINISI